MFSLILIWKRSLFTHVIGLRWRTVQVYQTRERLWGGENSSAVFFHTTCYGNKHSPAMFVDRCSRLRKKKKNLLSSDGCSTTFEISVSSRLLSLQGQRSSRRRKGAVGREEEEQNGKKKSWCWQCMCSCLSTSRSVQGIWVRPAGSVPSGDPVYQF